MTPQDHNAPPPPDSDAMLVQRTLAGEQRAYELLVIKYQRRVERLIGRMVRDVDLVQDIAQETFNPGLSGAGAVSWRRPVLHLALPDRRQYRQETADGTQARPAGFPVTAQVG